VTEKILEDFYLGCPGNKLFHVCDKWLDPSLSLLFCKEINLCGKWYVQEKRNAL
jgi:hypothetical protein